MSTTAAKKASAKKPTGSSASYLDMIKEAIAAHPTEARQGLGRPTIKKFIHAKHPETSKISEAAFNKHISKAIQRGAETKALVLPKGVSGKVKLAPKADKSAAAAKPKAATATKKAAEPKKAATGTSTKAKTTKPKTATATKKAAAPKKTASSTTTKAKKPAAKKAAAPAKKRTPLAPTQATAAKAKKPAAKK